MKNLSSNHPFLAQAYHFTPQGYQLNPQDYVLEQAADSSVSVLAQGLYHHLDEWVALELTAEQMLHDELHWVGDYIASDAAQMWGAIKDTCLPYELALADMLKRAAGAPD